MRHLMAGLQYAVERSLSSGSKRALAPGGCPICCAFQGRLSRSIGYLTARPVGDLRWPGRERAVPRLTSRSINKRFSHYSIRRHLCTGLTERPGEWMTSSPHCDGKAIPCARMLFALSSRRLVFGGAKLGSFSLAVTLIKKKKEMEKGVFFRAPPRMRLFFKSM